MVNRIIIDAKKKRFEYYRDIWADELLPILWAYHITHKETTRVIPFLLASEAVMPMEITHTSSRVEAYEPETKEEGMRLAIDLFHEIRDEANTKIVEYQ